jgi:hypothetical protein
MLKVFQADFHIEYGNGIMLIAANNEAEARELMPKLKEGHSAAIYGRWVFDSERLDLLCPLDKPQILESFTVVS